MPYERYHDLGGHQRVRYVEPVQVEEPRVYTKEELKAMAFQAKLSKMHLLNKLLTSFQKAV